VQQRKQRMGAFGGDTPPRVFWQKSLDIADYKGVEFFDGAKEFAIA
jgi:hypothetical protein